MKITMHSNPIRIVMVSTSDFDIPVYMVLKEGHLFVSGKNIRQVVSLTCGSDVQAKQLLREILADFYFTELPHDFDTQPSKLGCIVKHQLLFDIPDILRDNSLWPDKYWEQKWYRITHSNNLLFGRPIKYRVHLVDIPSMDIIHFEILTQVRNYNEFVGLYLIYLQLNNDKIWRSYIL